MLHKILNVICCALYFLLEHPMLNCLNVPPHNRQRQLQTKEMVSQAAVLLRELVRGLTNFYTYSEQRSQAYPCDSNTEPISDVNKKVGGAKMTIKPFSSYL